MMFTLIAVLLGAFIGGVGGHAFGYAFMPFAIIIGLMLGFIGVTLDQERY